MTDSDKTTVSVTDKLTKRIPAEYECLQHAEVPSISAAARHC